MICEKKFSNLLTMIESVKLKITNQEYLDMVKKLKEIYDVLEGEMVCEECGECIDKVSDDDSDDDNDYL